MPVVGFPGGGPSAGGSDGVPGASALSQSLGTVHLNDAVTTKPLVQYTCGPDGTYTLITNFTVYDQDLDARQAYFGDLRVFAVSGGVASVADGLGGSNAGDLGLHLSLGAATPGGGVIQLTGTGIDTDDLYVTATGVVLYAPNL